MTIPTGERELRGNIPINWAEEDYWIRVTTLVVICICAVGLTAGPFIGRLQWVHGTRSCMRCFAVLPVLHWVVVLNGLSCTVGVVEKTLEVLNATPSKSFVVFSYCLWALLGEATFAALAVFFLHQGGRRGIRWGIGLGVAATTPPALFAILYEISDAAEFVTFVAAVVVAALHLVLLTHCLLHPYPWLPCRPGHPWVNPWVETLPSYWPARNRSAAAVTALSGLIFNSYMAEKCYQQSLGYTGFQHWEAFVYMFYYPVVYAVTLHDSAWWSRNNVYLQLPSFERTASFDSAESTSSSNRLLFTQSWIGHFFNKNEMAEPSRDFKPPPFPVLHFSGLHVGHMLAEGSSARVYRGSYRDESSCFVCALKRFLCAEAVIERGAEIIEEARITWDLKHKNVVELLGVCYSPPFVYLAYELCEKGSLQHLLELEGPMGHADCLRVACGATEGVAWLHSQGYIHRDIKPENYLVTAAYEVKLADFGESCTQQGGLELAVAGTPQYQSPELIRGERDYTEKVDIYALGITLWQLLTARMPYDEKLGIFAMYDAVRDGLRPVFPDDAPRIYVETCQWLWEAEPARRPTAEQVLGALCNKKNPGRSTSADGHVSTLNSSIRISDAISVLSV